MQAQDGVQAGVHHLRLDKAYLRCTDCKSYISYILARCNEVALNSFVGEACHVGSLAPELWFGHVTHAKCRAGNWVECTKRHAKARISEEHVELNDRLKRRCSSAR